MKIIDKLLPVSELGFGQYFGPKMAIAHYRKGAWENCRIVKTEDIPLSAGAKVFHYAQEIFEGLKAYRQKDGGVALFRPADNVKRMSHSARIMSMPPYPEAEFMRAMKELIGEHHHLVPERPGSLYLRPTMLGTTPTLGVAPAEEFLFFILLSPAGGYFGNVAPDMPSAINLWVSTQHVRAVRGGLGSAKTGANYAASLAGVAEAKKRGYSNVLFLDAIERRYVEELSGMNFFVVEDGVLKTSPLGDTILDGVTRKAVLDLARHYDMPVKEEAIDIERMISGVERGKVTETFACGTAASITCVKKLSYKEKEYVVGEGKPGPVAQRLFKVLIDTQYGNEKPINPEWIVRC